ncbi:GNAT family N-acetyltransferase [Bacillus sp. 1P06AnD]|uniref:GNAT family N-acetyltransferase n=1 Tax=Bacillus sp. 1P06AnD TaxID=3132208 RepID=UPI0039A06064
MIEKLTQESYGMVMEYLKKKPAINLFMIGDLENFGFDQDFQEFWGDFTEDGILRGVLLRYKESFIPYSEGDHDVKGFADIIKRSKNTFLFSGSEEVTSRYEPFLENRLGKKQQTYFCECTEESFFSHDDGKISIRSADWEKIDNVTELLGRIEEFPRKDNAFEDNRHRIETGTGRTYYIEEDGQPVSSASTTAENTCSAMVMAVCTDKHARGKGYASRIVSRLVQDLLAEGKTSCLFYDNPVAGKIYKEIGFRDIGCWAMYR